MIDTKTQIAAVKQRKMKYDDFEPIRMLGSGGFGKVLLVRKISEGKHCGKLLALKIMNKTRVCRMKSDIRHAWAERSILQTLEHPFLVKMHFAFQDEGKLFLALEYCPGGELFGYLERCNVLPEDHACFYMSEVLLALGYLHSNGVIYRDVKPENILLDYEGHCKLTDFNLAVQTTSVTRTFCGTCEYIAPEMYMNMPYDKNVDWWCLGILLFDMLSGNPPWSGNKAELKHQVLHSEVPRLEECSSSAFDIITALLQRDPQKRLGAGSEDAEAVKQHPFFKHHNVDWEKTLRREVKAPFCPHIQSETDTSMFCSQFTKQPTRLSYTRAVADDPFQNFSYAGSEVSDLESIYAASRRSKKISYSRSISNTSSQQMSLAEENEVDEAEDFESVCSPSQDTPHTSFFSSSAPYSSEVPQVSPLKRRFLLSSDFEDIGVSTWDDAHHPGAAVSLVNELGDVSMAEEWHDAESDPHNETQEEDEDGVFLEQTSSAASVFLLMDDSDCSDDDIAPSLVCLKPKSCVPPPVVCVQPLPSMSAFFTRSSTCRYETTSQWLHAYSQYQHGSDLPQCPQSASHQTLSSDNPPTTGSKTKYLCA